MSDSRPIDAAIARLKLTYPPSLGRASEDPEPDLSEQAADEGDLPAELSWPPPGLAHIHGLLTRLTTEFWFAAFILMAPVAIAELRDRTPEVGSWGAVAVLIVVGVLLFGAYMRLLVLFNRAASAVRAGYPKQLVWHVAADWARNTPEVLRGQESFERLSIVERTRLLDARVVASRFGLGGAVWITATFPFWLAFGAAGRFATQTVWFATLLPAAFCVLVSLFFRVREIRASYANRIPDEEDRHAAQQARGWRSMYGRAGYQVRAVDTGSRYRVAATAAVFAIFLVLIPLAMALFSMVFPILLQDNLSAYSTIVRLAALAPLRAHRLPSDTAVTPAHAGEAYHALIMAGSPASLPVLRSGVRAGLPREEFPVLARAAALDFAGTRFNLAQRGSLPPWRIEPGAHRFREAAVAYAEVARQQLQRGQRDSAETTARAILSAGFVISDDALKRSDALAGAAVVQVGADALAAVYRGTARAADAERISGVLYAAAAASQSALVLAQGTRTSIRGWQHTVLRRDVPRAIRWDLYTSLSTLAHCGSLPNMVFGSGQRHAQFSRAAHDALVRYPADEEYFAIASTNQCNYGWVRDAFRGYR